MRVVEVISGFGLGGAERALARRLAYAPSTVESHVVVTRNEHSHLSEKLHDRVKIHYAPNKPLRFIRRLKPDVILTHNPREALRLLSSPKMTELFPTIVIAHNEITSEFRAKARLLDLALPLVNARAAMHIAVSQRAAAGPQARNARHVKVIHLGGELDPVPWIKVSPWSSDTQRRLLVLARLSPQKNLKSLLEAVRLSQVALRDASAQMCVAGTGPQKSQLQDFVEDNGLLDLIVFADWVEPASALLSEADALMISSTHEGGPLTLYESLLAGCQVVSTPVGVAPEIIRSDPGSCLLAGSSIRDLQKGLEWFCRMEPLSRVERRERSVNYAHLHAQYQSATLYEVVRRVVDQSRESS